MTRRLDGGFIRRKSYRMNVEDIRKLFPTVCHALSKPVIPKRLFESIHQCLQTASYEQFTGQ